MNKLKQLFFISLVISIFCMSSCKKEQNIISGKVCDLSTEQAIEGVTVDLYATTISSGTYSNNFEKLYSTSTDADGNYVFEFESKAVGEYKLVTRKKGYHDNEVTFTPEETSAEYNKNLMLPKAGYIKYTIRNAYGVYSGSEDDVATIRIEGVNPLCSTCCSNDLLIFSGLDVYEQGVWNVVADEEVTITRTLKRINLEDMPRVKKLTCQQGDTIEYIWNY